MFKKVVRLMSIFVAIVCIIFAISGLMTIFSNKNVKVNLEETSYKEGIEDVSINKKTFQYINHTINDFKHLNLIENGGLQTMSQLGLTSENCKYYRAYDNDAKTDDNYFSANNGLMSAAAIFDYSGTVKELLSSNYSKFLNQEPIVEVEDKGLTATLFWKTDNGILCMYCVNDYYAENPNADFKDYNVVYYVEHANYLEYKVNDSMQHPQNLIDYLEHNNYSVSDVFYDGYVIDWIIEGVNFDSYSWKNGLEGCLMVEIDEPYRIYRVENFYPVRSTPFLVWEGRNESNTTEETKVGTRAISNDIKLGIYYDSAGNSTINLRENDDEDTLSFDLSLYRIGACGGSIFLDEREELRFSAYWCGTSTEAANGIVSYDNDAITLTTIKKDSYFPDVKTFVHEDSYVSSEN